MKKGSSSKQSQKRTTKAKRTQESVTIWGGFGRQKQSLLHAERRGRDIAGRSGSDHQSWDDSNIRFIRAGSDRHRGRNPFSVAERSLHQECGWK
jgi:hypothetical protein